MHQGHVAVLAMLGAAAGLIEHLRGRALGVDQGLGKIRSLMQRNEVILGNRKLKRAPPAAKLKRRQVIDLAALSGCGDRI
jgi:hypothetical protein